jgi:hypothetical protein
VTVLRHWSILSWLNCRSSSLARAEVYDVVRCRLGHRFTSAARRHFDMPAA